MSKDSLIITNPPITQHENQRAETLTFVRDKLLVRIDQKSLKACDLLKRLQNESAQPAMILQFVHFRAKDTVYSLSRILSTYRHTPNGKPVFIQHRLLYHDVEIKKAADNINTINTTHKCQVKVLVNQRDWRVFKQIKDVKQLELANNQAVIKQQHIRGSNDFKTESSKRVSLELSLWKEVKNLTKPPM